MTILEDATVPRPRLAEMVDRIDAIAHAHDVPIATFGHAGDGNLHPTSWSTEHDDAAIKRAARGLRRDLHGGHRAGRHDHRRARRRGGEAAVPAGALGADQMALLRRIKAAFDPAGILNPGKLGS